MGLGRRLFEPLDPAGISFPAAVSRELAPSLYSRLLSAADKSSGEGRVDPREPNRVSAPDLIAFDASSIWAAVDSFSPLLSPSVDRSVFIVRVDKVAGWVSGSYCGVVSGAEGSFSLSRR